MIGFKKIRRYWYAATRHSIGEIWMLHNVCAEKNPIKSLRPYEINPKKLEQLILAYKDKGYEFVSIEEAGSRMCSKQKCNKFVCITLDDGYENNFTIAYPIFKKHSTPFCIYIAPALILGEVVDAEHDNNMMSINQLRELSNESLCTLAGHTYSHVDLNTLTYEEQYDDIKKGLDWLSNITTKPIKDFSYPFGRRNDNTIQIIKSLGVERAVLAGGGGVLNNTKPLILNIPRILVDDTYAINSINNNTRL